MQTYVILKGQIKNISTSIFKLSKLCTCASGYHWTCYRPEWGWKIIFSLLYNLTGVFGLHTSSQLQYCYISTTSSTLFLNFWPWVRRWEYLRQLPSHRALSSWSDVIQREAYHCTFAPNSRCVAQSLPGQRTSP